MALSNAERQKRHRERLKAKAGASALFDRLRDGIIDQVIAEDEELDGAEFAVLMQIRKGLVTEDEAEAFFAHAVQRWIESRIQKLRNQRKPAS